MLWLLIRVGDFAGALRAFHGHGGIMSQADRLGSYTGVPDYQCVAFCRATTDRDLKKASSAWRRGPRVMNLRPGDLEPGTVIATFENASAYRGHCALFQGYLVATGQRGISVWNANWPSKIVSRRKILVGGSGVVNADNYYVVLAPL